VVTSAAAQVQPESPPSAGFVSRLLAFTLDLLIISAIITVATALSVFLGRTLQVRQITSLVLTVLTVGANILIVLVYYVGFLVVAGQTPGKRIMGLRVIMTNGKSLSMRRSFRRFIGYWLSLPLFWGYLMVIVDDRRRAFHDKFAGTRVVYDRGEAAPKIPTGGRRK
jgi:uncharacterized RDD family membrane protein YckC